MGFIPPKDFGPFITHFLQEKHVSKGEVEDDSGLTRKTLTTWETGGVKEIRFSTLQKFARYFDMTKDDLIQEFKAYQQAVSTDPPQASTPPGNAEPASKPTVLENVAKPPTPAPPIGTTPTVQGPTPQPGDSRGSSVKISVVVVTALVLISIIAALVGSQFFKPPQTASSRSVTPIPTLAQSGATITFNALGGGSSIIQVYPGVGKTLQDRTYNGTYRSGETKMIVCETKGRTITSDTADGEQYRQSDVWYKLYTPPGTQPQYATAVYADVHGSVPQC